MEAARWYENALKIDPSRALAHLNLGDAYARAGQSAQAKKAYQTFVELAPGAPRVGYAKQQIDKL
jgi:Tfp pilus assembly protein PilF